MLSKVCSSVCFVKDSMVLWIIRIISVFLFFFFRLRIIKTGDVTGLCILKNKMSLLNDHVYLLFMESCFVSSRVRTFKFGGCVSNRNI